ncbi:MAG: hypothetical protein LBE36_09025 [Flavobacteriaceae bacterium]|jgi:hypothetical protein|nr:hypothetical protein [Flavobacteriaceae bacterium]
MKTERKIFKYVLWNTIEDYTMLMHLLPDIYNDINERYDDNLTVAKKVLLFYLENGYVTFFYESWKNPNNYTEIPKDKALKLLMETSSWENPDKNHQWITVSATKKGEELYYSGQIENNDFILPHIL